MMLRNLFTATAWTVVTLSIAIQAAQPAANQDAQILAALDKRLKDYVALHEKLHSTLPALSNDATPADIDKNQRALGALVQKARRDAERGDIFGPTARAMIRRILARALNGPDGAKLRTSIMDDNPGPLRVRVNSRYPEEAPRSAVPPQLLLLLPKLPEDLGYRFIGDRLLLVDLHAQIVVDFIENALPN
jgi:hypothetical protein